MQQNRLEYLLKEWGLWMQKHIDWADCLGANVLYRAGILSGRIQESAGSHRILCDDPSPSVKRTDRAIRRMTEALQDAVYLWYCLPENAETNKPFTLQELADACEITERGFRDRLTRAHKALKKSLTTV